jgi:phosphoribosyl-dephospho-CoA transferase
VNRAGLLRRHELVWLSAAGWQHVLAQPHEAPVRECIEHWRAHRLPLVVGRQAPASAELALGLPAPLAWERRKIALTVPPCHVLYHDRFPKARDIARLLQVGLRARWLQLAAQWHERGLDVRVHGSHGWQCLTGLRYLTPRSDIDLLLPVGDAQAADAAAAMLAAFEWSGPRLDGELLLAGGCAVAWCEWLQWRSGGVDRIMVKRLHGVSLEEGTAWLHAPAPQAA